MYGSNFTGFCSNIQLCLYMTNKRKKPHHESPIQISLCSFLFACISPLFSRKRDSFIRQVRQREIKTGALCRSLSVGVFPHECIQFHFFSLYVSLFLSLFSRWARSSTGSRLPSPHSWASHAFIADMDMHTFAFAYDWCIYTLKQVYTYALLQIHTVWANKCTPVGWASNAFLHSRSTMHPTLLPVASDD